MRNYVKAPKPHQHFHPRPFFLRRESCKVQTWGPLRILARFLNWGGTEPRYSMYHAPSKWWWNWYSPPGKCKNAPGLMYRGALTDVGVSGKNMKRVNP